jgi:hypothetical protein
MSWTSSISSRISIVSATQHTPSVSETTSSDAGRASFRHKTTSRFTDGEQMVWDDLVDETQLAPPFPALPSYPEISLLTRPCCAMMGKTFKCTICGFSQKHL